MSDENQPDVVAEDLSGTEYTGAQLRFLANEYMSFIRRFIEILDAIERWEATATGDTKERLLLLKRMALTLLFDHGIRPTARVGGPLDLSLHEVVGVDDASQGAPDTITGVVQAGYEMGRMVIRMARVRVAGGPGTRNQEVSQDG